jgi:hypothetical protein
MFSETPINSYEAKQRHIPEDANVIWLACGGEEKERKLYKKRIMQFW